METTQIIETINMVAEEHLDIRTVTMGISLLDTIAGTPADTAKNIYDKIKMKTFQLSQPRKKKIHIDFSRNNSTIKL